LTTDWFSELRPQLKTVNYLAGSHPAAGTADRSSSAATANLPTTGNPAVDSIRRSTELSMMGQTEVLIVPPPAPNPAQGQAGPATGSGGPKQKGHCSEHANLLSEIMFRFAAWVGTQSRAQGFGRLRRWGERCRRLL
jgi:hypothetical protein